MPRTRLERLRSGFVGPPSSASALVYASALVVSLLTCVVVWMKLRVSSVRRVRSRVLLIPGVGGTALHQRDGLLRRRMWFPLSLFAPKDFSVAQSWRERVRVRYVKESGDWSSSFAVEIDRDVRAVRNLTSLIRSTFSDPFGALVDSLQRKGVTVDAFGYDFRRVTGRETWRVVCRELLFRLMSLHRAGGGAGVVVVAHSFGGVLFRAFCQEYGAEVSRFVRAFVAVACPFAGTALSLRTSLTGSTLGICFLGPKGQYAWFADLLSNMSCILATLPRSVDVTVQRLDGSCRRVTEFSEMGSLLYEAGQLNAMQAWVENVRGWLDRAYYGDLKCVRRVLVLVASGIATPRSFTLQANREPNYFGEHDTYSSMYTSRVSGTEDGDGMVSVSSQTARVPEDAVVLSVQGYDHNGVLSSVELQTLVWRACTE